MNFQFKNVSGQNYVLPELGEKIMLGKKEINKGKVISADENKIFVFSQAEIDLCPLLSHLISTGSLIAPDSQMYNDERVSAIEQSGQTIVPLEQLREVDMRPVQSPPPTAQAPNFQRQNLVPNPHPQTSPPRDIMIDEPTRRSVLIDQEQHSHEKSIYDDGSGDSVKKK